MHAQAQHSLPLLASFTTSLRLPRLKRPPKSIFILTDKWGRGCPRRGWGVSLGQLAPSQALSLLARRASGSEELEVLSPDLVLWKPNEVERSPHQHWALLCFAPYQSEGAHRSSHHGSWDSLQCQLEMAEGPVLAIGSA